MALRVVLADDNFLVREGIAALLAEVDDVDLIAGVGDPQSLMKAVTEHAPDAVLTDIRMPPTHTTEGIDAAKQIRADHPDIGVVVLAEPLAAAVARHDWPIDVHPLPPLLHNRPHRIADEVRRLAACCVSRCNESEEEPVAPLASVDGFRSRLVACAVSAWS